MVKQNASASSKPKTGYWTGNRKLFENTTHMQRNITYGKHNFITIDHGISGYFVTKQGRKDGTT